MLVIGIVGGISSGKSRVTDMLVELGAYPIHADQIGHQVLQQPETIEQIRNVWGDRVLDVQGMIDRRELAKIVFLEDSNQLTVLEQITHPKIEARIREILTEIPRSVPAVVLDAPIMIEAGWDQYCDKLLFVECPESLRWQRASQRNWSKKMFESREASQTDIAVKRERATDVVDNSGTLEQLREQVHQIWRDWGLRTASQPAS